jgi:hypothetical protein
MDIEEALRRAKGGLMSVRFFGVSVCFGFGAGAIIQSIFDHGIRFGAWVAAIFVCGFFLGHLLSRRRESKEMRDGN